MRILAALREPAAYQRLRAAFPTAELLRVSPTSLFDHPQLPSAWVVVWESGISEDEVLIRFRRWRRDTRACPCVLYVPFTRRAVRDALQMLDGAIDGAWFDGTDDTTLTLRRCVETALLKNRMTDIATELVDVCGFCDQRIWEGILLHIAELRGPADLARYLNVSSSVLHRRLRNAHIRTGRRLLGWCRLLVAGALLEREDTTVEAVALALNYSSATAFQNACRSFMRARPRDIRDSGSYRFVLAALCRDLTLRSYDPVPRG